MSRVEDIVVAEMREDLCSKQICCNIPPEDMRENEEFVLMRVRASGTTGGWRVNYYIPAVKCACEEGCWHYILTC